MNLADWSLLTDENIDAVVVQYLRDRGFDVRDVCEEGLQGTPDVHLLQRATGENRVIFTHDADFGRLAVQGGEKVVGIVYLRPGHIEPSFTIATIDVLLGLSLKLTPPFLLVARRSGLQVTIRYRPLGS